MAHRSLAPLLLVSLSTLAANAQPGQMRATIHLHHDDPDSIIQIGETVTWTLSIAFQNAAAAEGGNLKLIASDNLGFASEMTFTPTNGGFNADTPQGPHLPFINWTNSLLLDAFGHPANRANPFTVGSFQFTATGQGTFTYDVLKGWASAPFLTLANSPLDRTNFDQGQPDLDIDSLAIVPSPAPAALLAAGILLVWCRRR
ncbi:MAG: hypothetical protein ACF8Q5_00800 [Phycisphaerales bacterium JB040]